ncbi:hypothetical protein Dimus_039774 [Dionaea muscipula]
MAEVLLRAMAPQATLSSRTPKRLPSNYTPSYPIERFILLDFMVTSPVPVINNIPFPNRSIMTSEDNALAAVQAVATATRGDLDHYLNPSGFYEKDWIHRDMRAGIARLVVAAEASLRMQNDLEDKVVDRNQEIRNLKAQKDTLNGELEKFKGIADRAAKDATRAREETTTARHNLEMMRLDRDSLQWEAEQARREAEQARLEPEEAKRKGLWIWRLCGRPTLQGGWTSGRIHRGGGHEWLSDSCRGARMQGYWMALGYLRTKLPPDATQVEL